MMRKKLFLVAWAFLLIFESCITSSSTPTSQTPENTLFSVNNKPISADEFLYVFNKNRYLDDSVVTEQEVRDYLELYIKFKLKIEDALALGLDQQPSFKTEFETYRKQLTKPYLTENTTSTALVQEAYERLKTEVNAAHILLMLAEDASPADTLAAYQRMVDIRKQAIAGKDFHQLAAQYSEDPSAQEMGGRLGYFTGLQMVYQFEDAAYKTEVGQISPIVRTRFGYHIIKVLDKRPSQGKVKVSHIMVRASEGQSAPDSLAAYKKVSELHEKLSKGANWEELCSQFSDDLNTRNRGGLLPAFGTGSMVESFEKAAFGLTDIGEISQPIKSPYGWHIIRLEEKIPLEPFEKLKASIENKVSKDSRSQIQQSAFLARLKREYTFTPNPKGEALLPQLSDSSLLVGTWQAPSNKKTLATPLFTLAGKVYTLQDFSQEVVNNQYAQPGKSPQGIMQQYYQRFVDETLLSYEESQLPRKYPEYRFLIKEYFEGILLFQLMEEKVWNKASEDTLGLRRFFEDNLANYQWKDRAEAFILHTSDSKLAKEIAQIPNLSDSLLRALEKQHNQTSGLVLLTEHNVFEKGQHEVLDQINWELGAYDLTFKNRYYHIRLVRLIPAGAKQLKESKGVVISDYQQYLEDQWVKELRERYAVKIIEEELKSVIQRAIN
ncbi:peptidylprolyl isomerase [Cytophagales bacterium LB-30]|uniref:Peptidylprolyl isomerase n=1 Tax=Shiella aurantiaca TaxID=3058365 RepID=A0ABT8F2W4_9BACT|nr:peptidylprolyl isomerase [Shiella aurantiaca]MDN4164643.1 peptidylprolyl isomerase [Shiella aurantiaca]